MTSFQDWIGNLRYQHLLLYMGVILVFGIMLGILGLILGLMVESITQYYQYSPYVIVGFFIILLPVAGYILHSWVKKKLSPHHSPHSTTLILVVLTILLALFGTAGLLILGALSILGILPLVMYVFIGVVAIYLVFSEYTE